MECVKNKKIYFRLPNSAVVEEKEAEYFKLDPAFVKQLDDINSKVKELKLNEFDLDFLSEKVTVPSVEKIKSK